MRPYITLIIILFVLVYPSLCKEIAYAIGPDGEKPIGQANITTDYKGTDVVSFTVSAAPRGPSTSYKAQRTVESIKEEISKKVDRGNELIREEGLKLVGTKSGPQRINQICSIYDCMVGNWTFVGDWSGLEQFQFSNFTLTMGKEVGRSGKGDCDDFSILLASLIESIGGTPRIIFAYGPAGGHAYTEVYLGKQKSKDLDRILSWLRSEYNASNINVHVDQDSNDVWLNMDWWKDPGGANRPGGPFYQAPIHIPMYVQEDKTAPTPIENSLPFALFSYSPTRPEVGNVVSFNASKSIDPDGKIVDYEWDFGDGDTSHGNLKAECPHIYSSSGTFQVNLTITDNQGDTSSKALWIDVAEPRPEAIIAYFPAGPKVGEVITFDASRSKGLSGRITEYSWDFDDGYSGNRASMKHQYLDSGTYNVKLIVINDKGAMNTSVITVTVSQEVKPGRFLAASPLKNESIPPGEGNANATELNNKGAALYYQGKYDEAIQAYNKALEINPQFADAWSSKGNALNSLSKYDEAIQACDKAIEINPQFAEAWNNKGAALYYQGKYDEAIQAYDKAIEINPQFADAWSSKGNALKALGRTTEADAAFAKAKELGYEG